MISTLRQGYEARLASLAKDDGANPFASNPFAQGAAYVRGEIVPADEAMVPLFDLGFLRSDLTYDVPAVWDGRFFRLDDHLARLERSCAKLRLTPPLSTPRIREMLIELVRKTGIRDAYVDVIVTRGRMKTGVRDPRQAEAAIYAFVVPYIWIMPLAVQETGGSAIVTRDARRTPPGSMDPTVKNLQWGDLTRGFFEAFDRGASLPLLPDADGNVTEGCYNVFAVHDGVLTTPGRGVLEGVTRLTAVEIARAEGWSVSLTDVPVGSLYTADEIFLSSTAGGIMPITTLDGAPVGGGQVGPVTRRIWERYWDLHSDPKLSFAVDYG
ncbi:MAG: aminotransferase class IV [Caulobacteraceae bacterium]|nr:aminotransferase class IV [Caulobacteraceae bacterium]